MILILTPRDYIQCRKWHPLGDSFQAKAYLNVASYCNGTCNILQTSNPFIIRNPLSSILQSPILSSHRYQPRLIIVVGHARPLSIDICMSRHVHVLGDGDPLAMRTPRPSNRNKGASCAARSPPVPQVAGSPAVSTAFIAREGDRGAQAGDAAQKRAVDGQRGAEDRNDNLGDTQHASRYHVP